MHDLLSANLWSADRKRATYDVAVHSLGTSVAARCRAGAPIAHRQVFWLAACHVTRCVRVGSIGRVRAMMLIVRCVRWLEAGSSFKRLESCVCLLR